MDVSAQDATRHRDCEQRFSWLFGVPSGFTADCRTNDEGHGDTSGQNADDHVQVSVRLLFLREVLFGFQATFFFNGNVAEQCFGPWREDDEHEHGEGNENVSFHGVGVNENATGLVPYGDVHLCAEGVSMTVLVLYP